MDPKTLPEPQKIDDSERRSAENHRRIVENANEAIFVIQEGVIGFPNEKFLEITGFTEKDLTGRCILDIVHPDDRLKVEAGLLNKNGGKEIPAAQSFRIFDKGKRQKWMEVSSIPYFWNGRPSTLFFLRDITDYKAVEKMFHRHLAREMLVAEISSGFIYLPTSDTEGHFERVLQILGEFTGVDRAFLSLLAEDETSLAKVYE